MTGIYWDCDGTLMNTESAYAYAWQEVLKRRNLNLPIQHFDDYVGIDDKLVHQKYSEKVELPSFSETMDEIALIIIENFTSQTLYSDAHKCLDYFYNENWQQACVSASPQKALEDKLNKAEISKYFDFALGGDSVRPRNKPFPDIYNLAINKLGTSKNIIVEDSPPGIQSGKSSGNYVVAIDRGIFSKKELSNADVIVEELTPDLFIQINKTL
jgi:beta-phosphoglucomutase-like phosphatase (HAD superfamily)